MDGFYHDGVPFSHLSSHPIDNHPVLCYVALLPSTGSSRSPGFERGKQAARAALCPYHKPSHDGEGPRQLGPARAAALWLGLIAALRAEVRIV